MRLTARPNGRNQFFKSFEVIKEMAGPAVTTLYGVGYNQDTLEGGMQLGMTLTVYDFANEGFKELMLVQASEQIRANGVVSFTETGIVEEVDAAGDMACGVNDVSAFSSTVPLGTGAIVAADNYFFITTRGLINPLVDAGVAALAMLATTSATPGQLAAWADGGATFAQTNLQALEASGAGGTTLAWMY